MVLASSTDARLPAHSEGLHHRVHSLGDIALSTNPETVLSLLMEIKSRLFAADTRAQKLQLLLRGAKVIGNTDTSKEATTMAQLVDQLSLDMQAKEHVPTLGASAHAGDDSEPELRAIERMDQVLAAWNPTHAPLMQNDPPSGRTAFKQLK